MGKMSPFPEKSRGFAGVSEKYGMVADRAEPSRHAGKSVSIKRQAEASHGGEIGEPGTFDDARRAERPRLRPAAQHRFKPLEHDTEVRLSGFEQAVRRSIAAVRPMPVRAVDDDRIETLIGETLERPREDSFGDTGRKKRTLLISLIKILDDVARVDDRDVIVKQHRNFDAGIGVTEFVAHLPGQCIDIVVGKPLEVQRDGNLACEGAYLASVKRNRHSPRPFLNPSPKPSLRLCSTTEIIAISF